jgi:hypothetical protein
MMGPPGFTAHRFDTRRSIERPASRAADKFLKWLHFFSLPLGLSSEEAFDNVLHIRAADDHLGVFPQNLLEHFFSFTIDADHIFEIHDALSSLTRMLCFRPLPPEIDGPLPAELSLKDPRLSERRFGDHRSHHQIIFQMELRHRACQRLV